MEKINIIKLLINNKESNDNNNTDFETQQIGYLLNIFFDEYIEPLLIELNNKNIDEYDHTQIIKTGRTKALFLMSINILRELVFGKSNNGLNKDISYAEQTVNLFSLQKYQDIKGNDDLDILQTKDIKLKKEIANKIVDVFVYTNNKRLFFENYIVPLLKLLNANKRIVYKEAKNKELNDKNFYIDLKLVSLIDELYFYKLIKNEKNIFVDFLTTDREDYKQQVAYHIVFDIFLPHFESNEYKDWVNDVKKQNLENENFSNLDFNDYSKVIKSVFNIN